MSTSASDAPKAAAVAHDLRVVVGRLRRRMREVATDGELSPSQVSVLSRLGKGEPGADTASGLAALEHVRPQSMATTLAALEDAGLIRRDPDPADGRRLVVTLTDPGRERAVGDGQAHEQWLARTMAERFDADELAVLARACALLARLDEQ
ncbi:MAG: MarR family transcriptional regulator [Actinobacteria bacterium]|nr:MarR family transcriptional regulator [Actinomycetota bacterium]